ncbi:unnamed protein product [Peronospora belbahrii]|nr:unnamed protein product [Peronospora belbahrii]
MSFASDDEMSTELAVAGNAVMSSLYARYAGESSKIYAGESSKIDSTTFLADIDAAVQEIQRVWTGVASEAEAAGILTAAKDCRTAPPDPVQAELDGVDKEHERLWRFAEDARKSFGASESQDSAQGDERLDYNRGVDLPDCDGSLKC